MTTTRITLFKILFVNLFAFFSVSQTYGQETKQELLELLKRKELIPEEREVYLCRLSCIYKKTDSIKAYYFADQALQIARSENSPGRQAIAYEAVADVARYLDNVPKLIKYADSSYTAALTSKEELALAYGHYAIAYKYEKIGIKDKYIYYMLKSLAYFEKKKIRYDKLVNGYENLGSIFIDNNDLKYCEKYNKKALDLAYESRNPVNIANGLTSWALFLVRSTEQKSPANIKMLQKAETYYLRAIAIFESENIKGNLNLSYGRTCLNLSNLYLYHFFDSRPQETLNYLKKTEEVCLKLDVPIQLMVMYGQQAQYYTNLNDIANIEKVLKKIEQQIAENPAINSRYYALLYKNYMDLAELKNDFPAYRKYFALYDQALRVRIEKENRVKEYNASIRFETEKKSQEIKLLRKNLETNKKVNYLYIALVVFVFFTLLFMLRSYYFRQKSYVKTNLLLQKANEEAAFLSKIKEEEARIAVLESELKEKELQIAVNEKIMKEQVNIKLQQELMTNNLQLEKKNDVLKDIKSRLQIINSGKPAEIKNISKTIDKSMEVDEEFELLKTSLENTNPAFFSALQEKASGTLTKLDFKYCGYIKLGMSTKEIAGHMNIETQSMRMARYRIKQKLNLDRDTDLDEYIGSVY
ncbi:MAG: hypothetical protein ABI850_19920 [Flavobacterium sp.]